ncbi:hypothetical protein RJT34_13916 [Clitoria ternatea]|uniref:RNase H type-1 domain-containing protein n=1 Tax=Clitoria ternatea TaxID=43366 RepID=A0AAN9PMP2_CLITE
MKQELGRYLRDNPSYSTSNSQVKVPIWFTWRCPPNGWVCLNTDGSVFKNHRTRCNRGPCGGLVRDSLGCFLGGFVVNLGATSVILSELWGVVHGLKLAWDLGCKKVKVDIDSGNALGLVRNGPVANDPTFSLVFEINGLVRRDWLVEFSHVFRESNRAADRLAHLGHSHSSELGVKRFSEPPSAITDILRDDLAGVVKQRGVA